MSKINHVYLIANDFIARKQDEDRPQRITSYDRMFGTVCVHIANINHDPEMITVWLTQKYEDKIDSVQLPPVIKTREKFAHLLKALTA